jgi:hypothetical protein
LALSFPAAVNSREGYFTPTLGSQDRRGHEPSWIGVEYFNLRSTTMNYAKPEVVLLGEALHVIEQLIKGQGAITETMNPRFKMTPAYDLDE